MDSFTLVSFAHLFMRVTLIAGLTGFGIAAGERTLDLNLKKAVKSFVDAANIYITSGGAYGTVWPLLIFILGVPAIFVYLLG